MKPPEAAYIEGYLRWCIERLTEEPVEFSTGNYITSDWVEDDLQVWHTQWTRYRLRRLSERKVKVDKFIEWLLDKTYYRIIAEEPRIGSYANHVFKIKLHVFHNLLRE